MTVNRSGVENQWRQCINTKDYLHGEHKCIVQDQESAGRATLESGKERVNVANCDYGYTGNS